MATKITYTQQGDYLLPDLKLPEQPKVEIGIWGKRRLQYLKNHHTIIYTNYLTAVPSLLISPILMKKRLRCSIGL